MQMTFQGSLVMVIELVSPSVGCVYGRTWAPRWSLENLLTILTLTSRQVTVGFLMLVSLICSVLTRETRISQLAE